MIAKLIGRTGVTAGQDFIVDESAHVGASPENEVRIIAPGVSRRHARIWRENDQFWLEDAGATNGTFLNGGRVQREALRHLDVITLGRAVDLIFLQRDTHEPAVALAQRVLNIRIQLTDGDAAGTFVDVPKGELSFGRSDTCNVVLDSRAIGKIHAILQRTGNQVLLQDLQSVNGTFVNSKRVEVAVLKNGDVINFAGVRSLTISMDGDAAPVADEAAAVPEAAAMPAFDQEWKTRFMWSPDEMAAIESARKDAPPAKPPEAATPKPAAAAPVPAKPPVPPAPKPAPPAPAQTAATPEVKRPAEPPAAPAVPKAPPAPPMGEMTQAGVTLPRVMARPAPKVSGVHLVGAATTVKLGLGTFTVGRVAGADVRVDDKQVSRSHATITVGDGAVSIEDLQTVNGTLVNGREIKVRTVLQNGDTVLFGATEFKVEIVVS